MADLAGSRVINEDELDSITLRHAVLEILGMRNTIPANILELGSFPYTFFLYSIISSTIWVEFV